MIPNLVHNHWVLENWLNRTCTEQYNDKIICDRQNGTWTHINGFEDHCSNQLNYLPLKMR